MDVKTIQLRWTDVEIRKYRLGSLDNNAGDKAVRKEEDDDELPAFQEAKPQHDGSRLAQLRNRNQPVPEEELEDIKDYYRIGSNI